MNTPKNPPSPIVITEGPSHFLVRIPSDLTETARKIPGRQWDGNRKMWVFPKDLPTYQALKSEFKAAADVFAIRQPHVSGIASQTPKTRGTKELPIDSPQTEEEFEEQLTVVAQHESNSGQTLESLHRLLLGVQEGMADHQRMLEVVIQKSDELTETLTGLDTTTRAKSKEIQIVKELPDLLDLALTPDLKLLEKALIAVAFVTCGRDPYFMSWSIKQKPLLTPLDFVCKTHELLKEQLEKIAGFGGPETKFWELLEHIRSEELIFCDRQDPIQVFHILGAMNALRNQFTHQRGEIGEAERMARSILYMMNMALVWRRVMVDEDTQKMETSKNRSNPS